jgi:signal transduction histidine kinase
MSTLARTQERELRSWLYGRANVTDHASVSGALDALVDQIEREHAIAVEAVSVGDAPIDDEARALLAAAREALVNAARHSGATSASLFVEIEPDRMTAYVRDQGAGFDRASVGADRRGIADSIEGRIESVGGSAEVTSTPGAGTEVRLSVPRSTA